MGRGASHPAMYSAAGVIAVAVCADSSAAVQNQHEDDDPPKGRAAVAVVKAHCRHLTCFHVTFYAALRGWELDHRKLFENQSPFMKCSAGSSGGEQEVPMSNYKNDDTASWDVGRVRDGGGQYQPPQRRSRHRLSRLQYWLIVLVVSAILAGCGWLLITDLCSLNKDETTATIEITSDDTLGTISEKLHDAGLVRYKWFFQFFARLDNADNKIGIGSYELNSNMDYLALVTAMRSASGNLNADTVRVTIPEGYTASQIISLLAQKGVSTETALTEAARTGSFSYEFISSDSQEVSRLEGFLFPDTYDFYANEDPTSALNRLLKNFSKKIDASRQAKVKASKYTLAQIITIASLIEKETDGTDQAKIASVIYNRLNDTGSHGTYKKLQIDAALLYALPDHTGAITNADKETDSPYNLYQNAGLPPTPIANPGLTSIDAALSPQTTDYYYYALGTDHLHHFFSDYTSFQNFLNSSEYAG